MTTKIPYIRYSIIQEKNPREIIMLRGSGCKWRRCRFCDYHYDFSKQEEENYILNLEQIQKVTGIYHKLEVINSGSFCDLDSQTMNAILNQCLACSISVIHFECHWIHRNEIISLRNFFGHYNIDVKIKIGVETFDFLFRESYLDKGITTNSPKEIASNFDEVCLLFGLPGQNLESMRNDIETGLEYFERVCINIMQKNSKPILPDKRVISTFKKELYPLYIHNPRVDILLNNTDFGVGHEINMEDTYI